MHIAVILLGIIFLVSSFDKPKSKLPNKAAIEVNAIMPAATWSPASEVRQVKRYQQPKPDFINKSIRLAKKKWQPKRWIFRPPMEPT